MNRHCFFTARRYIVCAVAHPLQSKMRNAAARLRHDGAVAYFSDLRFISHRSERVLTGVIVALAS